MRDLLVGLSLIAIGVYGLVSAWRTYHEPMDTQLPFRLSIPEEDRRTKSAMFFQAIIYATLGASLFCIVGLALLARAVVIWVRIVAAGDR